MLARSEGHFGVVLEVALNSAGGSLLQRGSASRQRPFLTSDLTYIPGQRLGATILRNGSNHRSQAELPFLHFGKRQTLGHRSVLLFG